MLSVGSRRPQIHCLICVANLRHNLCSTKRWMTEWSILSEHWKSVVFGIIIQLIHKPLCNVAYLIHVPGERLPDIGFKLLPDLSTSMGVVSEYLHVVLFGIILVCLLGPFTQEQPRFYSVCVHYA